MGWQSESRSSGISRESRPARRQHTGFSLNDPGLSGKRVEILREMVPGISRVAVFGNPDDPSVAFALKETETAAQSMGIKLQILEIRNDAAFDSAFLAAGKERTEGVIVLPAPLLRAHTARIVDFAAKNRLPAIYFSPDAPRAGGPVSCGVHLPAVYRRAAYYVDRILKGAKPADLPVEQPTRIELAINLNTAKALGIKVPQSLLLRADEVIQ